MRKIVLLIAILTFLSCGSKNEKPSKEFNVLFIGNSLTYYNDMPQILQEMMNEKNPYFKIHQITHPGMSLSRHLDYIIEESSKDHVSTRQKLEGESTETEKKIQEKIWDIIIMQTGTVSVLIPESRIHKTDPAIKKIKELNNNENSRYILFNTWTGKADYPEKYCYSGFMINESFERDSKFCSPEIINQTEHLKLINESYAKLAEDNSLELSNHGNIFSKVNKENPEFEILEDTMHPSKLGAFLSACIFYELLTGEKARDLRYDVELDSEKAELLKNIVS